MNEHTNPQIYPEAVVGTGGYSVTCSAFVYPPSNRAVNQKPSSAGPLATGTECGHILLWNLSTQTIIQTISYAEDGSSILSIHWVESGLVSYSRGLRVRYHSWCESNNELAAATCEVKLSSMCPTFCQLDYVQTGPASYIVSAPDDKSALFYQLTTNKEDNSNKITPLEKKLGGSLSGMVTCMRLFTDSEHKGVVSLLTGSEAGEITLHRLDAWTFLNDTVQTWKLCSSAVHYNTLCQDGVYYNRLVCECLDADHLADFRCCSSLNTHATNPVITLDYIHSRKLGCSAGAGTGDLVIWRIEDNSLKHHLTISTPSRGFNQVRLRPDCKLLISCGWDRLVRLHAPKKGTLLGILDFHRESVTCVTFKEDLSFVTASKDGNICMWNLYARDK